MKYSGPETTFLAYCIFVRVTDNPINETKEQQARLFTVSISPPPTGGHLAWCQPEKGSDFLVRRPRSNHVFSLSFLFNCLAYHSMKFAVIMANVGKRKAFSIGAEKHGINAFSQNEIEHFECCDDDVNTSGEVSVEDIVALVNGKKQLYCRFVFRYGGRTRRTMAFDCRSINICSLRSLLQHVAIVVTY
ncbi:hypothetical protein AVEN_172008-1 [Araneus ventricosus]|uniref:EF-hand domain-containing protein n=1 Tax=Araneus ventricosus TaxID=182803 RepID=A0A4Y2IWY2_ARAVE|nr:hypothetical protein AVEN_172008-1 [Araneus ventricosus]